MNLVLSSTPMFVFNGNRWDLLTATCLFPTFIFDKCHYIGEKTTCVKTDVGRHLRIHRVFCLPGCLDHIHLSEFSTPEIWTFFSLHFCDLYLCCRNFYLSLCFFVRSSSFLVPQKRLHTRSPVRITHRINISPTTEEFETDFRGDWYPWTCRTSDLHNLSRLLTRDLDESFTLSTLTF